MTPCKNEKLIEFDTLFLEGPVLQSKKKENKNPIPSRGEGLASKPFPLPTPLSLDVGYDPEKDEFHAAVRVASAARSSNKRMRFPDTAINIIPNTKIQCMRENCEMQKAHLHRLRFF